VPPEPGDRPARPTGEVAKAPASRRNLLVVAALVVVLLGAGGWFLKSRWSKLFPNTEPAARATPSVVQTPITRANELYKQGKRAVAIAQLKRVPPASPYYEEAQALIGQWEQEEAGTHAASGPSPEQQARRTELLAQARQAASQRRYLAVGPLLDQAATIAPLTEDERGLRDEADKALTPLKEARTLLHEEEYERSLRGLWLVLDKDSGNNDAKSLLAAAYYNLGVMRLQQGKPDEAETNLKEALNLAPTDAEAQRLLQLAQTYKERNPDLLFRIYTKYLNPRPL
jgi:tetratricopeptide (TPR) repeat protein